MKWIRRLGESVASLKESENSSVEVVELDEMHSYVGDKKTIAGYGLLLIDPEKDSSISLLVTGVTKRRKHDGQESNTAK